MARSQAYVSRVTGGNNRPFELEGGGNNEGVHRVGRRHSRLREKSSSALRDGPRQVEHHDPAIVEEPIDGGVEAWTPADLAKNRGWYPNECAALVRDGHDGARPVFQNAALRSAR
jgi:hypothetical protein